MKTLKIFLTGAVLLCLPVVGPAQEVISAATAGNLARVKELVQLDPQQVRGKDAQGRSPLHWACRGVHHEVLQYLVEAGADVNALDSNGVAPLHSLVTRSHADGIRFLLDCKADVNVRTPQDDTPLHLAAFSASPLVVRLLLERGAAPSARNKNGDAPLDYAAAGGRREVVDLLLDKGAEYGATGEAVLDLLLAAVRGGMERLTMAVIDRDGKELFKDESRNAEIMREAVKGGSVRLVELLLENRVPLQKKGDQYGWTPIHYAARQGQVAMVEFLIHSGVDVNARNPLGESAYNIAESTRNKELQDLIVKLKGKTDPRRLPTGPYLGQKPPGMTPKVFAPGIVSTADHEFSTSFSPDGKELYFSRRHPDLGQNVVMFSRVVDGAWTSPEVAPFAGTQMSFEPFVTPDNQRLFFQAGRVVDGGLHMFTLYVERTGEAWGEVKDPGEPFNPDRTMHVSATSDGTIYTTDISGGMMARTAQGQSGPGNECLGVVRLSNGRYEKLEKLGPPLNAIKQSQHPWVSPDESLMIFSAPKSGYPSSSALFVTRRSPDGSWSVPREVDLGISAGQPFVTPDGRYLFFSSGGRGTGKGDLYWVSARILDRTR